MLSVQQEMVSMQIKEMGRTLDMRALSQEE